MHRRPLHMQRVAKSPAHPPTSPPLLIGMESSCAAWRTIQTVKSSKCCCRCREQTILLVTSVQQYRALRATIPAHLHHHRFVSVGHHVGAFANAIDPEKAEEYRRDRCGGQNWNGIACSHAE